MSAENLNRVFIKAYGKGQKADAVRSEDSVQDSGLVVRFDTATVEIPAPHFLQRKTAAPATVAVSASASTQAAHVDRHSAGSEPASATESDYTAWDEKMMSILFGGSTVVAPNTSLRTAKVDATIKSETAEPKTREPSPAQPTSVPVERLQTGHVLQASANSEHRDLSSSDSARATNRTDLVSGRTVAESPEQTSKVASRNRSGEIFRLDRPSYAGSANTGQMSPTSESFEPDDESQTAFDMELQRAMELEQPPTSPHSNTPSARSVSRGSAADEMPRVDQAKRKEQRLRQSRIKIFNPLWEVDRLEWPQVCQELTRTIATDCKPVVDNLIRASQDGLQVMAITSPLAGEGTSTVACCLAMLAGKHGLNIALVDSNVENPSLAYQTNLDLEVDWHEAVAKRLPLEEVAVHSVEDQVTLVPLLERLNAPELNEQNVAMMLQELSQSFDLVIVDLGNMAAPKSMVRKLGELGVLNAVVAVVDRRLTSPDRVEACLRQIRQTGIASIGLVENFAA